MTASLPSPDSAYDYDLAVIGSGGAAFAAAIRARDLGQSTAQMRIQRLPGISLDVSPPPGMTVSPGEGVVLSYLPVEGGATAHVDGTEVETAIDREEGTVSLDIPQSVSNEAVVTISLATPEIPVALARLHDGGVGVQGRREERGDHGALDHEGLRGVCGCGHGPTGGSCMGGERARIPISGGNGSEPQDHRTGREFC